MQFLIDNMLAISVAMLSGGMLLWSFLGNRLRGVKTVDCVAALQLINHKNAVVIDVRSEAEFKKGRVLNAKLFPLPELKKRIAELEKYKEKPVLLMCHSGSRAADACVMLGKQGFTQVYALTGGIAAWEKANLPVERK